MAQWSKISTFLLVITAQACLVNHVYGLGTDVSFTTASSTKTATSIVTTQATPDLRNSIEQRDLSQEQRDGIVTIEFQNTPDLKDASLNTFYEKLRTVVADILNRRPDADARVTTDKSVAPNYRKKRADSVETKYTYTKDDIRVVSIDPAVKDDLLRTPVIAQPRDKRAVPADELEQALKNDQAAISTDTGVAVKNIHQGLPDDVVFAAATSDGGGIFWRHRWLFYVILVLIAIALLVSLLCCICMRCCSKQTGKHKQQPDDEEEIKLEPMVMVNTPAAMQERTPHNEPPPVDEENGWIIPMDQLSKEELEQPDVQISKL